MASRAPALLSVLCLATSAVGCWGVPDLAYTVHEETPANLVIGNVIRDSALDLKYNKTTLSHLRFSLLKESEFLSVGEENGVLQITRRLDREELCSYDRRNNPCVIVADVMVRPIQFFKMLKVQITVADINDNTPAFEKNSSLLVLSEGSPVGSLFPLAMAVDIDSDQHGIAEYKLRDSSDVFKLDFAPDVSKQRDLSLLLKKPLDREQQDAYQLVLLAVDKGLPLRTGTAVIEIVVVDENDNAPAFNQSLYTAAIPENAQPGSVIVAVKAFDPDAGSNGHVRYSLAPTTSAKVKGLFEVVPHSGEVKLKGMVDREDCAWHLVPVMARDSGDIPKSSMAYINVTVLDVNDNAPELKLSILTNSGLPEILENAPNGTFVALLSVIDADVGPNSQVTCHLSSPKFSLLAYYTNEYQVVVNSVLDRETDAQPTLAIRCADGGSPPLSGQIMLKVNVLDVNDNPPVFENHVYYAMPIQENNPIGLQVVQVHATDSDAGINAELVYSLGPEGDASVFSVDSKRGVIRANSVFDRELKKDYAFTVIATDLGTPPSTSSAVVFVRVEDVNDNAPRFEMSHYTMRVSENQVKFTVVGKVKATDSDDGLNGDIWYRLENDSLGPFVIAHNTGIVSTRMVLDREQIADYQVTVVATDYGVPPQSSSVRLTISVKDENDNEPFVLYPTAGNSTVTVPEDIKVNVTIATIRAVDLDVGENGRIGYFIHTGNKEGVFHLARDTGELKIVKDIWLALEDHYKLAIGVFDYGSRPNTVFASITVIANKTAHQLNALKGAEAATDTTPSFELDVNLAIVITLSSLSGVLSLVLIVAIIRIKKQTKENHSYNCRAEVQRLFGQKVVPAGQASPRSGHSSNNNVCLQHGGYITCSPYTDQSGYGEIGEATLQRRRLTTFGQDSNDGLRHQSDNGSASGSSNDTGQLSENLDNTVLEALPARKPCDSPDNQRSKGQETINVSVINRAAENKMYCPVTIPQRSHNEMPYKPAK